MDNVNHGRILGKDWKSGNCTLLPSKFQIVKSKASFYTKFDFSSHLLFLFTFDFCTFYFEHLDTSSFSTRIKECIPSVSSNVLQVSTLLNQVFVSPSTSFKFTNTDDSQDKANLVFDFDLQSLKMRLKFTVKLEKVSPSLSISILHSHIIHPSTLSSLSSNHVIQQLIRVIGEKERDLEEIETQMKHIGNLTRYHRSKKFEKRSIEKYRVNGYMEILNGCSIDTLLPSFLADESTNHSVLMKTIIQNSRQDSDNFNEYSVDNDNDILSGGGQIEDKESSHGVSSFTGYDNASSIFDDFELGIGEEEDDKDVIRIENDDGLDKTFQSVPSLTQITEDSSASVLPKYVAPTQFHMNVISKDETKQKKKRKLF